MACCCHKTGLNIWRLGQILVVSSHNWRWNQLKTMSSSEFCPQDKPVTSNCFLSSNKMLYLLLFACCGHISFLRPFTTLWNKRTVPVKHSGVFGTGWWSSETFLCGRGSWPRSHVQYVSGQRDTPQHVGWKNTFPLYVMAECIEMSFISRRGQTFWHQNFFLLKLSSVLNKRILFSFFLFLGHLDPESLSRERILGQDLTRSASQFTVLILPPTQKTWFWEINPWCQRAWPGFKAPLRPPLLHLRGVLHGSCAAWGANEALCAFAWLGACWFKITLIGFECCSVF